MPRARTTDDLLTDVRGRVAAPATNGLLSSSELLELATQELRTELALMLIQVRSEYWLRSTTSTIASGTATYRIPDRALEMGLRDVTVYDSAGREYDCVQVPADQRYLWTRGQTWAPTGPFAFTLDNGSLVLLPTPSTSGYTLRMRYYVQPSRLVPTTDTMPITSAASSTSLTMSGTAPSWVDSISDFDVYVDAVRGGGMYDLLLMDGVATSYAAPTLSLDSSTPIDADEVADTSVVISYGRRDIIAKAGETSYVQLPDAMWPLLVALTCRAYCEAVGDMRGLEAAHAMFERKKAAALGIMQPRIDGEVPRPIPLHTPLRGGRRLLGGRVW